MSMHRTARLPLAFAMLAGASAAHAGAFVFSDTNGAQVVTHPPNTALNGSSPTPSITVCLDPAAQPGSGNPTQAIRNAIAALNRIKPVQSNVRPGGSAGLPAGRPDFESVFLHELGHCMGMAHSALGPTEVGCTVGVDCAANGAVYSTISTRGANGNFDVGLGADGMRGSRDDPRGDDVNRHWYQRGVNNPFVLPPAVVDRTTHAVTTNYLPGSHSAVETATNHCGSPSADTAGLPGRVDNTQNAMFPVICVSNVLRELAPDDVATLRIARAGSDGVQGTGDDYAPTISYVGITTSCDIVLRFSGGGVGVCQYSPASTSANNIVLDGGTITVGQTTAINWHFNQTDTTVVDSADLSLTLDAAPSPVGLGAPITYTHFVRNVGPNPATGVMLSQNLGPGTTFETASGTGWSCDASGATLVCEGPTINVGASSTLIVSVDVPTDYAGAPTISSQASVTSDLDDPVPGNNSDTAAVTVDFVVGRIFANSFE